MKSTHGTKQQLLLWTRTAYRKAAEWTWVWKIWSLLVVCHVISSIIDFCNHEPNAREKQKIRDKLAENARIEGKLASQELNFDEEDKWLKIKARNQKLLKRYNQRLVREVMAEMENHDGQSASASQGQRPTQHLTEDLTFDANPIMGRSEDFYDVEER